MPFVPDKQQVSGATPGFKPDPVTPDSADAASQGNKPGAQAVSSQPNSPLQEHLTRSQQFDQSMKNSPMIQKIEGDIPNFLRAGAASMAPGAGSALGRIGQAGAVGGLANMQNADTSRDKSLGDNVSALAGKGMSGFLGGAALGAVGEGVAAGGSKLADYLMQKAVGLRKYLPGVGNQLTDMNLVGTKGMMAGQVDSKLASEESNLQELVKGLEGNVSPQEIAQAVAQKAEKFKLPSTGEASPFSAPELQKVRDLSQKLSEMPELTPQDLLALKRHGDYQGYTAGGNPATSTEADLGRAGADAARSALKEMSPDVAQSLSNERALITANKSLQKPDTLHQGLGSSAFFGKIPGQSLFGSLGAQGLQKGIVPVGETLQDPNIINQLFGNKSDK